MTKVVKPKVKQEWVAVLEAVRGILKESGWSQAGIDHLTDQAIQRAAEATR